MLVSKLSFGLHSPLSKRNKNVEMQVTMNDTKNASVILIRKLFLLMQNLGTLPNDVNLTMKLYYYDDSKMYTL